MKTTTVRVQFGDDDYRDFVGDPVEVEVMDGTGILVVDSGTERFIFNADAWRSVHQILQPEAESF